MVVLVIRAIGGLDFQEVWPDPYTVRGPVKLDVGTASQETGKPPGHPAGYLTDLLKLPNINL